MLSFTETITICTPWYNDSTGGTDYFFATITGVSWHSKLKTYPASSGGLVQANQYKVRIPELAKTKKQYVPPEHFTNPATQYTITPESRIILGDGTNIPADAKAREDYLASLDSAFAVKAVHDNRRFGLRHLYIEGA